MWNIDNENMGSSWKWFFMNDQNHYHSWQKSHMVLQGLYQGMNFGTIQYTRYLWPALASLIWHLVHTNSIGYYQLGPYYQFVKNVLLEEVISIHSAYYINQNLPNIQGLDKLQYNAAMYMISAPACVSVAPCPRDQLNTKVKVTDGLVNSLDKCIYSISPSLR